MQDRSTMSQRLVYLSMATATLVITSCTTEPSSKVSRKAANIVIALDASGSADNKRESFFKLAQIELSSQSQATNVTIFRFDSAPEEVYDGSIRSGEVMSRFLRQALQQRKESYGTNLYKLLTKIHSVQKRKGSRVGVIVFTDCGVETMTDEQFRLSKQMVKQWYQSKAIEFVKLVGVTRQYRTILRERIFDVPDEFFEMEALDRP